MATRPDLKTRISHLSAEQQELLRKRLRGEAAAAAPVVPAIPARPDRTSAPLSFGQQRLWFLDQLDAGSSTYNEAIAFRLTGPLRIDALTASFRALVQRHEILRTTFTIRGEQPMQVVHEQMDVVIDCHDLARDIGEDDSVADMPEAVQAHLQQPFDLQRGPLLRVGLFRRSAEDHLLIVAMHHIVTDGWSLGILVDELAQFYRHGGDARTAGLKPLPVQYADYAAWQRTHEREKSAQAGLEYWTNRLRGAPEDHGLPVDHPRKRETAGAGGTVAFAIAPEAAARLVDLARRAECSPFICWLTTFATLLHRQTQATDLVIGTPVANRGQRDVEPLIGFFVNTLALRLDLDGHPGFAELLSRVRRVSLDALANQATPFERVVEVLNPKRSLDRNPLFQVLFALPESSPAEVAFGDLTARPLYLDLSAAKFDLTLTVEEKSGLWQGKFEFNRDRFETATIERLVSSYQSLVIAIAADPMRRIDELPLTTAEEQRVVLQEWNRTAVPFDRNACIHHVFERQARERPGAAALIAGAETLTYAQLNTQANRWAQGLRAHGVGPEVRVGIGLERGVGMLAAVLAVLKAGGAYVPLDPAYPRERLHFMLRDSGCALVLTRASLASGLGGIGIPWTDPERAFGTADPLSAESPRTITDAGNAAYLIYTSGSTGTPKAVVVAHRSVVNLAQAQCHGLGLAAGQRVALFASLGFDASVSEMWTCWQAGATLVLADEEQRGSPAAIHALLAAQRVNVVTLPPTVWALLPAALPDLQIAVSAGERCPAEIVRRWSSPSCRFINAYGPTEITVCATLTEVRPDDPAPAIGRPIANTGAYVLDSHGRPVPIGVFGELYISGAGLARGYWNRAALTAERFVPNPFSDEPGERLYRTGDLVRYRADGSLEYRGRIDQQVKIRGFRIELGEIEALLEAHPAVKSSAVVARPSRDGSDLIAYIVPVAEPFPTAEVRAHLRERLPDYMLPAGFVVLPDLPRNAHGKVNRDALPAPTLDRRTLTTGYEAPSDPVEAVLVRIWSELLGRPQVGVSDDLFELGGHSLLAAQIVSRVGSQLGVTLALRELFENPTIARLARIVRTRKSSTAEPILPIAREPAPPLSFAQERLWFLDRLDPNGAGYNVPVAMRLRGPLEVPRLEHVFTALIARHESLRTTFYDEDGQPRQRVGAAGPCRIAVDELPATAGIAGLAALQEWAAREAARPFKLAVGPLLRVQLLRLAADDHLLLLTLHHIVTDAWSMTVLIDEMSALYEALAAGKPVPALPSLPIQYADFAAWQRGWLTEERLAPQIAYWKERLTGLRPAELPGDFPRPARQTFRGMHRDFALGPELARELKALSQRCGATLFMTTLAAFKVLLFRSTQQEDISLGVPVANRHRDEIERLVGFFVNTLVVLTDLAGNPTFRDLLARVRQNTLEAYANQDLPFERLVDELKLPRDPARASLFQIMFAFQNAPRPTHFPPGLTVEGVSLETGLAKFDLTVELTETGDDLVGSFEYNRDLFSPATMERLLEHFRQLLRSIVAAPDCTIAGLELLPPGEKALVLGAWAGRRTAYPRTACVHHLFEEQAKARPDAIAVVDGGHEWSYARLNARANQIAHFLMGRGVGPESRVGVHLPRGYDQVAAVLGILKAGGAYVPLDPESPPARLQTILADSGCRLVLGTAETRAAAPVAAIPLIALAQMRETVEACPDSNPGAEVTAESAAYVIYTSGSTGNPKGVEVPHRAIVRLAKETDFASFGPEERCLLHSPLAFDASTLELWGALLNGGRLYVLAPGPVSLSALAARLREDRITMLWLTASLFHAMVDEQLEALGGVRQVLAGGDVLLVPQVERFRRGAPRSQLINGYGPTENTTFTCCHRIGSTETLLRSVPIGRPIANTEIYILDRNLQPVPVGIVGELFTGGDGLARGYVNQPALTAARFVPHPFSPEAGARLYFTGDLARYRADGTVEFLGRTDHQVKIRGFRIELGEIEGALAAHPAVKQCVVVTGPDAGGGKRVLAYVVVREPATLAEIRAYLKGRLPDYMVPAAFVFLDELPMTSSGKVDRKRLPAPGQEWDSAGVVRVQPRHPTEATLAAIWTDLLELPEVGVNENFFELGGHSLLATRVVSRIATVLDVAVELRDFFEHPTIAELAAHVQTLKRRRIAPISRAPREGRLPLSSAQERLWFLHRLEPESAGYNVPVALRLEGQLDVDVLSAVLDALVERHESMRTAFPSENGRPYQQVNPPVRMRLALTSLEKVAREAQPEELQRRGEAEARLGFSLGTGPVFRAQLLKLDRSHHVLLLTYHHIVTDGWSMGILVRELVALYEAFRAGRPSPLAPPALQYVDYAVWQRGRFGDEGMAAQLDYWKKQLAGVPVTDLPIDRPRPPVQTHRGTHCEFKLRAETGRQLKRLGRDHGATLFMTLLAAFDVLLWRWCRQTDLAVGTPIANRNHPDTEDLFGYFVNTLVLRCRVEPRLTFVELLRQVRQTTLDAYNHQDLPFDQLVDSLNVVRDRSRSPLFQTMLVLQNAPMPRLALPGLVVEPLDFETQLAKFDLTVVMIEEAGGSIAGTVEYNTDLFDAITIERLIASYEMVLESAGAHPEKTLDHIEFLTTAERRRLVLEWNNTAAALPTEVFVHRLFSEQARLRPDAIAVVSGTRQLTYRELDEQTNQVAHALRRAGIGAESRVGVCMERGWEMIVAVVGILKAGGAYVPLDPAYPLARLTMMIEDSGCQILLVPGKRPAELATGTARLIDFALWRSELAAEPTHEPAVDLSADNAAYMIYTSGSTGRPKGVLVPHRGIANLQQAQRVIAGASAETRSMQFASLNFDASVSEMWVAFCVGGALVVASEEQRRSPAALAAEMRAQRVNLITLPPTLAAVLPTDLPDLHGLISAGERCPPELVRRWSSPTRHAYNFYGPTEVTVAATMAVLDPAAPGSPPIGRPLPNTLAYVLAPDGALVPPGVPGELYVGGMGVVRGYWARPGLTASVFLPDPFSDRPGARLYRTGDLVRQRPNGELEFLGRLDGQIKLRGMRVELGEIENVLAQHPLVKHCIVVCQKDASGDDRLAAYVVARERIARTDLQAHMKTQLPDHMVPAAIAFLDALPINGSGKVDRLALPAIGLERREEGADYRAPRSPLEEELAAAWKQVLDLQNVGVRDNFFEVGGNSMKVVQLLEIYDRKYPGSFTIGDLFDHHTIEQQAARIAPPPKTASTVAKKPRRLTL